MTVVAEMHAFQRGIATDHPFDFGGLPENGCVISNAQAHFDIGRRTKTPNRRNALGEASDKLIFHVLSFLRPTFRGLLTETPWPVSQLFSLYFRAVVIACRGP